ncbi:MAG TPA: NUDIX domain-containing protein [Aggregatilineales bacterium]|nr:NUDIX domain-containing protein [Anaerolineales bacterium]HRE47648.1 NUDIX domain-containing protein [Aggregatilineales bacterium]
MQRGKDYIGVGVGAIIVDEQGRLFLAKRGEKARNERGLWEFPGGSVEFGERLTDALIREMYEEFGIIIGVEEMLTVTDHILPEEGQHWVSPSYICHIAKGTPTIREPEKCAAIDWFALEDIPSNLTQVTGHDLALYRAYLAGKTNR